MRGKTHLRREAFSFCAALLFLLALTLDARAMWRAAGDVLRVTRRADGVELTLTSGARVAVTLTDLETVRVRLAPRGGFERDFSYAVEPKDRKLVRAAITETRESVEVSSPSGASVRISRRPFLVTVLDGAGRVVVEDDPARPHSFDPETGAVEASKRRAETEVYYGFGEKAMPMSLHTQSVVMWNSDTYAYPVGLDPIYQSIPFFIALHEGRAYGLFLDNTYRTYFDMGKQAPARYTFGAAGGELNYYVFTGGRGRFPKEVLRDYTDLTGRTPLPPLWALGYQQSRWSYFPESRVREIARNFRERRIPADAIYLDIDYMDGYRVFTWDKTRFPDPVKMLRDLRADGFRAVVIIDPGIKVDENYSVYRDGRAGDVFHRAADGGEFHANVWPGLCAFPDFTSPAARAWFGSLYKKHTDEGVAGFWNDMNEPATFLTRDAPQPHHFHHPSKTFPQGDTWVDWWTGRRYEGGKDFEVDAPLDRLPLFARAGAVIPTQPVVQHTGEMASAPLTLVVVLPGTGGVKTGSNIDSVPGQEMVNGADNTVSRVYEDAGEGYEHRRGAYRILTATVDGNAVRLARQGAQNVSRPLTAVVFLGVSAAPREVRAGGRAVENVTFDRASGSVVVALSAENVEEVVISPRGTFLNGKGRRTVCCSKDETNTERFLVDITRGGSLSVSKLPA